MPSANEWQKCTACCNCVLVFVIYSANLFSRTNEICLLKIKQSTIEWSRNAQTCQFRRSWLRFMPMRMSKIQAIPVSASCVNKVYGTAERYINNDKVFWNRSFVWHNKFQCLGFSKLSVDEASSRQAEVASSMQGSEITSLNFQTFEKAKVIDGASEFWKIPIWDERLSQEEFSWSWGLSACC